MPDAVIVDAIRTPDRPRVQGLARPACARTRRSRSSSTQLLERNPEVDPAVRRGGHRRLRPAAGPAGQQHRAASPSCCPTSSARRPTARPSRATAPRVWTRSASPPTTSRPARATSTSPAAWSSSRGTTSAQEAAHPEDQNEHLQGKEPGAARRVHRDGPDRGERRRALRRLAVRTRTSTPSARQELAVAAQETGFFDREIVPGDARRRHRRLQGRRPARRHHAREARVARSRPSRRTARSRPATPARSTTAPRRR